MADLTKNYNRIISELEEKIKDPQELSFVKSKITEIAIMFMDTMDKLVESNEGQKKLEKKVKNIQKTLKKIEEDIYIDDDDDEYDEDCHCDEGCDCDEDCDCHCQEESDDYEFEIACPYCNYEFVTGKDSDLKDEIECPNCHNIIELDWDDYCDGECNHCSDHCYNEQEETEEISVNEDENEYKKSNEKEDKSQEKDKKQDDENEDDM